MLEIYDGNTKIIIYSDLATMTDEEHAEWVAEQRQRENPVFSEIDRILSDYYNNRHRRSDCEK